MAGEKVKQHYASSTPDVGQSHRGDDFQVIDLEPLVEMKLNSWRRKDQVHLLDLIGVGLIDRSWPERFLPELGQRLQELLDNSEG